MLNAKHALVELNRIASRKPERSSLLANFIEQNVPLLSRIAIEVAVEEGDPIGKILARKLANSPDPKLAISLLSLIPGHTVALKETAVIITAQIILAVQSLPGMVPTAIASARTAYAFRLSEAGRLEDSLHEWTL